jgi:hypothetical protein
MWNQNLQRQFPYLFQLAEARKFLQQYEVKTRQLTKETEFKNKELETIRLVIVVMV